MGFLSSCVWQETFTAQIIDSFDDFEPPCAGVGEGVGSGSVGVPGIGQVQRRGSWCESVPDDDDGVRQKEVYVPLRSNFEEECNIT